MTQSVSEGLCCVVLCSIIQKKLIQCVFRDPFENRWSISCNFKIYQFKLSLKFFHSLISTIVK